MFIYEHLNDERILIHLHGFASNIKSTKVKVLRDYLLNTKKYSFFTMDINYPETTTSQVLEFMDILIKGFERRYKSIFLSGSSHGGYIALNYLRFYNSSAVKGLILFAPSYSTLSLILSYAGEENCQRWLKGEEELRLYDCDAGIDLLINRDFAKDILEKGYEIVVGNRVHFPKNPPVDVVVVHGREDKEVPVSLSRVFTSAVKVKRYLELDDDHRLSRSFEKLITQDHLLELFE